MTVEVSRRSCELFDSGFFCAESVLTSVAESRGIQTEWIPGIATGLCGGVSLKTGVCGAVSGAIMAIGLAKGRRTPDQKVDETYALVRRFIEQFEGRFGSIKCKDLIGCELLYPDGLQYFSENNLRERCRQFVEEAAGMAASLLG